MSISTLVFHFSGYSIWNEKSISQTHTQKLMKMAHLCGELNIEIKIRTSVVSWILRYKSGDILRKYHKYMIKIAEMASVDVDESTPTAQRPEKFIAWEAPPVRSHEFKWEYYFFLDVRSPKLWVSLRILFACFFKDILMPMYLYLCFSFGVILTALLLPFPWSCGEKLLQFVGCSGESRRIEEAMTALQKARVHNSPSTVSLSEAAARNRAPP